MPAKVAAVCVALFTFAQPVLLALLLFAGDDQGRTTVRAVDAACVAAFAGAAAVALLVRPLRNALVPGSAGRGHWRLLGVALALIGAGQGLQFAGLLTAAPEPLSGWLLAGHVARAVGVLLVGASVAVALWRAAGSAGDLPGAP
jgi:hypothetical protein